MLVEILGQSKKAKDIYLPEFDEYQKSILDLNNDKKFLNIDQTIKEHNEELNEIKSKSVLNEDEKKREKVLNAKIRQLNKKVNSPYLCEYKGEGCGVAKKIANLLVRICKTRNLAKYKLVNLDEIDNRAYEFGFLDPKIQFNYEFNSIEEINDAFKIFIDCNNCNSMDDFENLCKKYDLSTKEKREYFLTTKSKEKDKISFDRTSLESNIQENTDEDIITKYFNIKFKILIKIHDDFIDKMEIRLVKKNCKNNQSPIRIFLMDSCELEPRNRSFKFYGYKSQVSNLKPVPFWIQNTKIKSLNKSFNN